MLRVFSCFLAVACTLLSLPNVSGQETTPPSGTMPAPESLSEKWDRLIYVPFRELSKVFDNQESSVVIPYAEYMDLLKRALAESGQPSTHTDVALVSTQWNAVVEKDLARISVELRLNVAKESGWAVLPVQFGAAAIGKVEPDDGSVILKGTGQGQYELLVRGAGQKTVRLELLAAVQTSPEDRSFSIQCPPSGISELVVSVPEPDQTIRISPLQVLLPADELKADGRTVVKASLGATNQFEVHWNPKAGSRPVMDLLSSVTSTTTARIETGLVQTRTEFTWEILRGELRDITILVPSNAQIIDVVAAAGRIRSWNASPVGTTHQVVRAELLVPATERFQIEIQTERPVEGDLIQLIGKAQDGSLQGIHADGVVREAGKLLIVTDPSLSAIVTKQSGIKQVESTSSSKGENSPDSANAWEYSGSTGTLIVQLKPVEPRLLVNHTMQYVYRDDELRLRSVLRYDVERAGVFQLSMMVPESLTIDSVSADGMSEFNVDKSSGRITLSLTQKRMGAIEVTVQAHQAFDSGAENVEMELPTLVPEGAEREIGTVTVHAPEFLDVITVDEKLVGLFPIRNESAEAFPDSRQIASWNFTRRPVALFTRTTPRPAQISATIGTTVRVEPELIKQSAVVTYDIQNAGIDTFRIAVPEAVASDVRFRTLTGGHTIQQRNKANEAENGWVIWTLVLQDETTGLVQIGVDWDITLKQPAEGTTDAAQALTVEPPRVLVPFTEEQAKRRRVILTQTRGEIRLLRHESLSITAESQGDTTEEVDVRELEFLEPDGYLAYRYFSQPASATIRIQRHELHEVAATVVSRAAIEVVTERQPLASWRLRLRITTSERQRLRIDLPQNSELQAPLLNNQRTTIEKAGDVRAADGWEAYYVNISRPGTSDEEFMLTLLYRCPIADSDQRPYPGTGGVQSLHLPIVGSDDGSTVMQQVRLAVWSPDDLCFPGAPDGWTPHGRMMPSLSNPLRSPSATAAASELNEWIRNTDGASADFPTQGSVAVFRAAGHHRKVQLTWWSRPFLTGMISGTLVLIGLILRRTSWDNRITLTLLTIFAVAVLSLSQGGAILDYAGMALPGVLLVAALWLSGLVLGQKNGNGNGHDHNGGTGGPVAPRGPAAAVKISQPVASDSSVSAAAPTTPMTAGGETMPSGTVAPAPEVVQLMEKLMRGGK